MSGEDQHKLRYAVAQLRHLYGIMAMRPASVRQRHDLGILRNVLRDLEPLATPYQSNEKENDE